MSMSAGSSGGVNSDINVTPMIDVLLVLLIIFMIVQALKRAAIDIQIPPVDTGVITPQTNSNQIVLQLLANGNYAINGTPYTKAQLEQGFHTIYDARPAKLLFVSPDPTRVYGDLIEAIDIARGAGVQIIGFTPIEAN